MLWCEMCKPEHLSAGAEREAEARDHGRALQPSAARGGRDHVPEAVHHVYVAGVTAALVVARQCRLTSSSGSARARFGRNRKARRTPACCAGAKLERGVFSDEFPSRLRIRRMEQLLRQSVHEPRVSVVGFPIGKRELGTFYDGVYVFDGVVAHAYEVETGEQSELLEKYGSLAPQPCLAHRVAVVVQRRRSF